MTPLSRFKILFASSSLLVACGHGPLIDVCISRPASGGLVCVSPEGKQYNLVYAETDKYIAFSPQDAKTLLNYCGVKDKTAKVIIKHYLKDTETPVNVEEDDDEEDPTVATSKH